MLVAGCSAGTTGSRGSTTTGTNGGGPPGSTSGPGGGRPGSIVVAPVGVRAIIDRDAFVNNQANEIVSIPLQDSHEACMQDVADDDNFRFIEANHVPSSDTSLGGFASIPTTDFVPRQTTYPAYFTVVLDNKVQGQPTTESLATYVRASSAASWKLEWSSFLLGSLPGFAVPAPANDASGFAKSLDPSSNAYEIPPGSVASRVAAALSSDAGTGTMPHGFSVDTGPNGPVDPATVVRANSRIGQSLSISFSTDGPPAAAPGLPSPACPTPAYALKDGAALVTFLMFETDVYSDASASSPLTQPSTYSGFGVSVKPGVYSMIREVSADFYTVLDPPHGSRSPVEVVGENQEVISSQSLKGGGATSA